MLPIAYGQTKFEKLQSVHQAQVFYDTNLLVTKVFQRYITITVIRC
jgi:nicotinamide riboside kinase